MINLELMRYGFGLDSTLGRLYATGGPWEERTFVCFTLEDQVRPEGEKVKGETAIPPGTYRLDLRTEGGMHTDYLGRFAEWHKGMLWLRDVPNFEYIYIHPGNTDDHTDGCILPGSAPVAMPDGEFQVARSVDAYRPVYLAAVEAITNGERAAIHVYDTREALP